MLAQGGPALHNAVRPKVVIRDAGKAFLLGERRVEALRRVALEVRPGEFLTMVGPSGCGKSTLLNLVAGLDRPTTGEVLVDGLPVNDVLNVGYMLQKDALMPWRTARQNVELGLELKGLPPPERHARSTALLEQVGLAGFADHYPHQLSGGMRQRVNIARTLAVGADLLLMDEPFAALDSLTRDRLQNDFLRLWEQTGATVVFVTHDLGEAVALSDRVVVMSARPGTVYQVYDIDLGRPRDTMEIRFTNRFIELYRALWEDLKQQMSRPGV